MTKDESNYLKVNFNIRILLIDQIRDGTRVENVCDARKLKRAITRELGNVT